MTQTLDDIFRPLWLTGRLLVACSPQLLLIGCLGMVAHNLLLYGAVSIGLGFPLGGMIALSLVVLAKLIVLVMMFVVLRPHLPELAALRQSALDAEDRVFLGRALVISGGFATVVLTVAGGAGLAWRVFAALAGI